MPVQAAAGSSVGITAIVGAVAGVATAVGGIVSSVKKTADDTKSVVNDVKSIVPPKSSEKGVPTPLVTDPNDPDYAASQAFFNDPALQPYLADPTLPPPNPSSFPPMPDAQKMPSWVLPVAGLAVVGGLAAFMMRSGGNSRPLSGFEKAKSSGGKKRTKKVKKFKL